MKKTKINEIENGQALEETNKPKVGLLKRSVILKTLQLVSLRKKKKKRKKTINIMSKEERGDSTIDPTDI